MSYFGATVTQVMQEIQGADTGRTIDESLYGTTAEIEVVMGDMEKDINSYLEPQAQDIIQKGKIVCHKVIESVQDTTQTAVDYGQDFIGTVNEATFKLGQNNELSSTEDGIDSSEWDITANVLTISADKSRGDTFYAYYSIDPDTIVLRQLARLLIKMSAIVLIRREVIGGDGAEESEQAEMTQTLITEVQETLAGFKESVSISGLMEMNLCDNITASDTAKSTGWCRK